MAAAVAIPLMAIAASTATAVYSSEEQKRQARLSRDAQKNAINDQKKELNARSVEEAKMAQRDEDQAKREARRASAGGKQSTILTSPLGVVENAPQANKTILGA